MDEISFSTGDQAVELVENGSHKMLNLSLMELINRVEATDNTTIQLDLPTFSLHSLIFKIMLK